MTVITTIKGFGDLFWVDVVAQIDTMNDTVMTFQAQAKKLPKVSLTSWQQRRGLFVEEKPGKKDGSAFVYVLMYINAQVL